MASVLRKHGALRISSLIRTLENQISMSLMRMKVLERVSINVRMLPQYMWKHPPSQINCNYSKTSDISNYVFPVTANHFRHSGLGPEPKGWQQSKGERRKTIKFHMSMVINSLTQAVHYCLQMKLS